MAGNARETLGLMTAPRWKEFYDGGQYVEIWIDGENITTQCQSADDRMCWAVLEGWVGGTRERRLVSGWVEFRIRAMPKRGC